MARDSDAGARFKPRRSSASLDPNRSGTRRVNNRRTQPRPSVPPRLTVPPRGSNAPLPREGEADGRLGTPRNRRVPRSEKRATSGPALGTRLWLQAVAALYASAHVLTSRVETLRARLRGQADAETQPAASTPPARVPRLMQVVGVCLALASAYGLARFVQKHLTTAPAFAIDAIDVKGLARVERAELLQAAGLALGVNVFAQRPEEIRARLLRHPWILSAQVERKLPSRIAITVQERAPVALLVVEACAAGSAKSDDDPICEEASSLYLVSDDAMLFKRLSGKDPVDLPVITGVTRQRFASDPDLQRRILVEAVALMRDYRNSGLWQRNALGEIHLESNDGYSLYVGEDLTYVRLGAKPFDQKLLRLKKVFERLEREHARAEYIYLDNEQRPDRVAVRLR
jgi:cell division protein FtsQ